MHLMSHYVRKTDEVFALDEFNNFIIQLQYICLTQSQQKFIFISD